MNVVSCLDVSVGLIDGWGFLHLSCLFTEHSVSVGPKPANIVDQKADNDHLKYLEGTDENIPKLQFTKVDTKYIKKALMALKIQNRLDLTKFQQNSCTIQSKPSLNFWQ